MSGGAIASARVAGLLLHAYVLLVGLHQALPLDRTHNFYLIERQSSCRCFQKKIQNFFVY